MLISSLGEGTIQGNDPYMDHYDKSSLIANEWEITIRV